MAEYIVEAESLQALEKMKAWHVSSLWEPDYGDAIYFAETRGKAHQMAFKSDQFEFSEWNDLRVVRSKVFDQYYTEGRTCMDWDNATDKRILVQHGWTCLPEDFDMCDYCSGKEWCDAYQEYLRDDGHQAY